MTVLLGRALQPARGHPRLMSREAAEYLSMFFFHMLFLSGELNTQILRWGNHLNVNFSTREGRVRAQLSLLLFLAEQDPVCGQKCYCWVGYNCFQWDNPHHFRAFKGSIRTCKCIWFRFLGWWEVSVLLTLNSLLTFLYSHFPWHICSFQLKRLLSKRIRSWKLGSSDNKNLSEQFLPTVINLFSACKIMELM